MDADVLKQVMEEMIPLNRYLGMKFAGARKGFARVEVPFRDELVGDPLRPALHSGVLSALANAAGGAAVWSGIEDDRSAHRLPAPGAAHRGLSPARAPAGAPPTTPALK